MKIKQYEALIAYIKTHYPDLVDKFDIWHDFDETKDTHDMWALYWGQDWGDTEIYLINLKFDTLSSQGTWKIIEEKTSYTDVKVQPLSYLNELEGIAQSLVDCEDGGDIKYIIADAEALLKKKRESRVPTRKLDG